MRALAMCKKELRYRRKLFKREPLGRLTKAESELLTQLQGLEQALPMLQEEYSALKQDLGDLTPATLGGATAG